MPKDSFEPWPSHGQSEIDAVVRVLQRGETNYWTGGEGRKFEARFAEFVGTRYGVAVTNGTVALDLIWQALLQGADLPDIDKLLPGDEVIVTPRTFLASVSSIVNAGLRPVFADVDPDSQNITPETVRAAMTGRTRAVLAVHLSGWPCDMPALASLAKQHNLILVEDCAQAHGASIAGRSVGSFGHAAAWSFCQDKIMTTGGEGGMVTTDHEFLFRRMWSYKDHGKDFLAMQQSADSGGFRWVHHDFGTNWRMLEFQAVIGLHQLDELPGWVERRRAHADRIWACASGLPGLRVPSIPPDIKHACYKCYVFVDPARLAPGWNRDRIVREITEAGVPAYTGSCPEVYLEKAFEGTGLVPPDRLPVARELGETSLMFLVHPTLSEASLEKTCSELRAVMARAGR